MEKVKKFIKWLESGAVYELDNSPILSSFSDEVIYDGSGMEEMEPDDTVVNFSWESDYQDYGVDFTRKNIEEGDWDDRGTFRCKDKDGNDCEIKAYSLSQCLGPEE